MKGMLLGLVAVAFVLGWATCLMVMPSLSKSQPPLQFTGEPSRGAFVPVPSPPTILSDGTVAPRRFHCLIAVVDDDPSVWHYRVWRDDESKALTGKGIVVVPQ